MLYLVSYSWSNILLSSGSKSAIPEKLKIRDALVLRKEFWRGLYQIYNLFCFTLGEFSASDSSLTDIQEQRRQPMPDPGLMPLPDSASDLDWSNLVDAAKAFEGKFSEYGTEKADLCASFVKKWFCCL